MLILSQVKKSNKKQMVEAGTYTGKVLSVKEPEAYVPGDRIVIKYALTDKMGNVFQYEETFLLRRINERTVEFDEYLEQNGVKFIDDFVGCEEELVIKLETTSRGESLPTIVSRKMLSVSSTAEE